MPLPFAHLGPVAGDEFVLREESLLLRRATRIAQLIEPPIPPRRRSEVEAEIHAAQSHIHKLRHHWQSEAFLPAIRFLPISDPKQVALRQLAERFRLWEVVVARLRMVLQQKPQPLWQELEWNPETGPLLESHEVLWRRLHTWLNADHFDLQPAVGHFADIPLNTSRFLQMMRLARRLSLALGKETLAFLDVGCGVGLKVWQAAGFVTRSDGLEYAAELVPIAQRLVSVVTPVPCRIMQGDALEFDDYASYDVIYFYKPMSDPEMLMTMERRIVDQSRPGTVLIGAYGEFAERAPGLGLGRITRDVYVTGHDERALKRLVRKASLMGLEEFRPPSRAELEGSYLTPILRALRLQGHSAQADPRGNGFSALL